MFSIFISWILYYFLIIRFYYTFKLKYKNINLFSSSIMLFDNFNFWASKTFSDYCKSLTNNARNKSNLTIPFSIPTDQNIRQCFFILNVSLNMTKKYLEMRKYNS